MDSASRCRSTLDTPKLLKHLIDAKANLEAKKNDGPTALHVAAQLGRHPKLLKPLLRQS